MARKTLVATTCSGCSIRTALDIQEGTATVLVPSNGKRGSLHVAAHQVSVDLLTTDDYLWMWDCPVCESAESWTEHEMEDDL